MGVSEMTRFGFGEAEFQKAAALIAACIRGENVKEDVAKFRADYQTMRYCFDDKTLSDALDHMAAQPGGLAACGPSHARTWTIRRQSRFLVFAGFLGVLWVVFWIV